MRLATVRRLLGVTQMLVKDALSNAGLVDGVGAAVVRRSRCGVCGRLRPV